MSLVLSDSHPALALSKPLWDYCGNFFTKHGLNYFQVIRVNQDGSTILLTNKAEFTKFAIEQAVKMNVPLIYSSIKKEVLNSSSYFFLWEPNLPVQPVAMVRNEFNMTNGLTLVERFATHYYMYAFAAPIENQGILDFYLNNIDLLRKFIDNFKEQQQKLLFTLEKEPLILPKALHDENLSQMILKPSASSKTRIVVQFEGKHSYLTVQEHLCISHLPLGLSSKQIAKKLDISPRTVEQYFERVKARMGCKSKRDLIYLLSTPLN